MTRVTNDLTEQELFRLSCAYISIRDPAIRAEFLELLEAWTMDQWTTTTERPR